MSDVSTTMKEYDDLMTILELPHALMGGTDAMREKTTTFLPKEANESTMDYNSRLDRTFLFGGYERTVSILAGEVFDKPVTLSEDLSEDVKDLSINIDLQNRNLTRFARDFFEWSVINGTGHILVDAPPMPRDEHGNEIETTREDDQNLGRRPYWVHVPASNLIGCKFDGQGKMLQARIKEVIKADDGDYGIQEIEQIRVLMPGAWEVWREGEKSEWVLYDSGASPFKDKIGLVSIYAGRKEGAFTAKPPLTGLAELNQQHWVSSSDQNNILHFCRVPILFGKMLNTDDNGKIVISSRNLIASDEPEGDLKFVEHQGKAISDGWKDLERLETLMALWGLELISENRSGNVTATERALTGGEDGIVSQCRSSGLSGCVEFCHCFDV